MSKGKKFFHQAKPAKQEVTAERAPDGGRDTSRQQSTRQDRPRARSPRATSPGRSFGGRQQGNKRRRDDERDYNSNPSKRVRATEDETIMDENHIINTLEYPERNQYPHAPQGIFGNAYNLVNLLHNANGGSLKFRQEYATLKGYRRGALFTCTLKAELPSGESVSVEGQGWTKRDSTRAAYVMFVVKIHELGVMNDIWPAPIKRLDKDTLADEKDAKVDIYNYSARFGLVPEFTSRKVTKPGRSGKIVVEVTVELQEQNIKATARGLDMRDAEIAASLKFKEQAEAYHAEHGEESISVRDSSALNVSNAKSFFSFYKLQNRNATFEAVVEPTQGIKSGSLFKGVFMVNGESLGTPVVMPSKKHTEDLACLVAAVHLTKKQPDLLKDFQQALAAGNGNILESLRPINMEVDEDAVAIMQETLRDVRRSGLPDIREEVQADEDGATRRNTRERKRLSAEDIEKRSQVLKSRYEAFMTNPETLKLREIRDALPMTQYRDQVLKHVGGNLYSVVVGATGSGKTTQVPQILLEDAIVNDKGAACNIVCTQPRRIAATSVARRVADERNEKLQNTVGYQVRFDPKLPVPGGSITYCTTGILLQQLQHNPDEVFDTVSHIVIDEVHERDILIDFLMVILKNTINTRLRAGKFVPQVVLMSATIDSELFAKYFQRKDVTTGKILPCPSLSVPGRTFPVKEKYYETILDEIKSQHGEAALKSLRNDEKTRDFMTVESSFKGSAPVSTAENGEEAEATIDWKRERTVNADGETVVNELEDSLVPIALIATTVAHIAKTSTEGAILVFLPGYDEIKKVRELLETTRPLGVDFRNAEAFKVSMLHSTVPAAEQAEVFEPVPAGCRKVILSTNIAETSVTIPDIQYVVDTGKLREKRYDQVRRITKLQCTWISKSNAKQRAGRAGRVQNGNYYALYCKARFQSLRAIGLPEMLRSDLQEICLDIKAQAFKSPIRDFLAQAIEPPAPAAVDASVMNLIALQALTEEEKLTALGRLLASMPVHPSLGKMIILGIIFRCLDPMIILGAAINERSPFVSPMEKRREAQAQHAKFLEGSNSDHFAVINAIRTVRDLVQTKGEYASRGFANERFIHTGAYRTIESTSRQIEEVLMDSGVIPKLTSRDLRSGELGGAELNRNSGNTTLIKALALSGVHPNLAVATRGPLFRTPGEKAAMIHPSSLNHLRGAEGNYPVGSLFSYATMQRSNDGKNIHLRDTTSSSPLMAALFGGRLRAEGNVINMDGWLPFYVKSTGRMRDVVKTIMEFRKALDRVSVLQCLIV